MPIFKLQFKNKSKYCKVDDSATYEDIVELAKKKFTLHQEGNLQFSDREGTIVEDDCIMDYLNEPNALLILLVDGNEDHFTSSTSTLSINSETPTNEDLEQWLIIHDNLNNISEEKSLLSNIPDNDNNMTGEELAASTEITLEKQAVSQTFLLDKDGFMMPSSLSAPSALKDTHTLPVIESKLVNAQLLAAYLKKNGGQHIFDEYQKNQIISNRTRRDLVNLTVRMMTDRFGTSIPKSIKTDFAKSIVENFPSLKDPNSTKGGYEIFYDDAKRTPSGYLAWRLRTVVRNQLSPQIDKGLKRKSVSDTTEEEPSPKKRNYLTEDEKTAIEFLKYACPTTQKDQIFAKMRETLEARKSGIFLLTDYPRFLDTPGLIEQDFKLRYPDAQDFTTQFKNCVKTILAIYNSVSCQKLPEILNSSSNYETAWDEYTRALLALIHMLPPTAKGNKNSTSRAPIGKLFERLLYFSTIGEPLEDILEKRQGDQPYLIGIGSNKAAIHEYKVAIDGKFLDTNSSCVVNAFDFLVKTHFVFQTKFDEGLENFFCFIQHFFYKIDNVKLTTKMRELQNRLLNFSNSDK